MSQQTENKDVNVNVDDLDEEVFEPGFGPEPVEDVDEDKVQPDDGVEDSDSGEHSEDQPVEGILAKDGKHIIPYKELEEARKQAQELKKQNEILQQLVQKHLYEKQDSGAAKQPQQKDPLEQLLEMDKDSFREYVSNKGVDALYEMREAFKKQAALEAELKAKHYATVAMQNLMTQTKAATLKGIVQDWTEENRDILEDPVAAEIVRALDRAEFQKMGIEDISQLSPSKARKHLEDVTRKARAMLQALGSGTSQNNQQSAKTAANRGAVEVPPSISRVSGDGGKPKRVTDLSGADLELAMLSMRPDEIEKLFEE